jgi:hypothetical protein
MKVRWGARKVGVGRFSTANRLWYWSRVRHRVSDIKRICAYTSIAGGSVKYEEFQLEISKARV